MGRAALLITHGVPALDRDGAGWLSLLAAETLIADGWSVTVIVDDLQTEDAGRVHALEQLGAEVYAGPRSVGARDAYLAPTDVDALLQGSEFSLAVIQFWGLGDIWIPKIRRLLPDAKIVVDSVDVHLLRVIRGRLMGLDGAAQPVLGEQLWHPVFGELNVYAMADAVFAVSERETELLEMLLGREQFAFHVPLGSAPPVDAPSGPAGRSGIVYVGGFSHPPNHQAVDVLLDDVISLVDPAVRARHPVRIVGAGITQDAARAWIEHDHVVPVGWVPELGPELDRARMFVAPLPNGAGVKTKLLGALSAGLPVITNRFGIEGMDVEPDQHLLLAETPAEFAAAIERLESDDQLWQTLSTAGRDWALAESGPAPAREALREALLAVLDAD